MTDAISVRAQKRAGVLDPICDVLLASGLGSANLRALAKAAGTSDRMLLYYFVDKDDLITAALDRLAERLAAKLDERTPTKPLPTSDLTEAIWSAVRDPSLWPFMVLFVEVAVRATRDGEPFASSASSIAVKMRMWIEMHLGLPQDRDKAEEAQRIMATVDGRVVLQLAGIPHRQP